ncbi:MAG TPA: redox-regulated ATPase YchF [Bacillota bacterium]|nr:redox-regulated ATPase YchF [Bacillota bacterium]HPO97215.1 redox-regulated ATPase YchF [Bacillota bacterium]
MKLGIVGLPNVGKSTLFNAITKAGAESANYPFCTIDPNVGVVAVPDERLEKLAEMYQPDKVTPTAIEFVDIAGLVKGASRGEGLGNKFLSYIREVDAIVHVVRCFEDTNIVHVDGSVGPKRDVETIDLELILADLETIERRIEKTTTLLKTHDARLKAQYQAEMDVYIRIKEGLESSISVRALDFTPEERLIVEQAFLLTAKPVIFAANVSEDDLVNGIDQNPLVKELQAVAAAQNAEMVVISARIEEEIAQLDEAEKAEYLKELGIAESGLDKLVKSSYKLLGLISFLTAGKQEVRAWTITKGTKAPQAAGKIHSDIERGFIRAEIVSYDDLIACGSYNAAKERGLVRLEGKDYIMQDGDVTLFRFNV